MGRRPGITGKIPINCFLNPGRRRGGNPVKILFRSCDVQYIITVGGKRRSGKVEAVVFDAPILDYYVKNQGAEWAKVVGEIFDQQKYGLALQPHSKLSEEINRTILALRESGRYEKLRKKWFGTPTI